MFILPDITSLILDDHDWFRRAFATLDEAKTPQALSQTWDVLSMRLDLHAEAEEEIFYPQLLKSNTKPEEETKDAISDHNKIRDAVAESKKCEIGSDQWWNFVGQARLENSKHMAEEERGPLADFRSHTNEDLRNKIGQAWIEYYSQHSEGRNLDPIDKDPEAYIEDNK